MPLYQWDGSLNIFDRPIAFHRCFVDIAGDVAGAVFLSQLCYWAKRADSAKDGWFYKSAEQWQEETGLSWDQQKRVRGILQKIKILEEREAKIEHRVYFRLNWEPLLKKVGGVSDSGIRESQIAQSEKVGPADQENSDSFNSTETTAENTTETTQLPSATKSSQKSTSPPSYANFRTRFLHDTGIRASSEKGLVALFVNLASSYGEDVVLDVIKPWALSVGKEGLKRKKDFAAKNFLEQDCEDFITAPPETDDKEASYAHGLEKADKWKEYEKKFPRKD